MRDASSYKTILILDSSPKFSKFSEIELDVTYKDGVNQNKIGIEAKNLWHCSIDAAIEFRRIITDLFPNDTHLTNFIRSGATCSVAFENWKSSKVSQEDFIQALFNVGFNKFDPEVNPASCSIKNSLSLAINCFNELCFEQRNIKTLKKKRSYHAAVEQKREIEACFDKNMIIDIENNCNLFIITSFNKEDEFYDLGESIADHINTANRIIDDAKDDTKLHIEYINVFILNFANDFDKVTFPVTPLKRQFNDGYVTCTMYTITGKSLSDYLRRVIMESYNLVSTTITGIPMKEESSATTEYDVELLHPKSVHYVLEKSGLLDPSYGLIKNSSYGGYQTVRLGWYNPVQKLRKEAFPLREISAYATPVDILSRPTLCFTGFLKKGKSIWLEANVKKDMKHNVPGKIVTHALSLDSKTGIIVQELAIDGKLLEHEFVSKRTLTDETNYDFIGNTGGVIITEEKLDELSHDNIEYYLKDTESNNDNSFNQFEEFIDTSKKYNIETFNSTYINSVKQEFIDDGFVQFIPKYHTNEFADLRCLIQKGIMTKELRISINALISEFISYLDEQPTSNTKRECLDSKFFFLTEIIEEMKLHNKAALQEFSLQIHKIIVRYRRIRNPSSLITVKLPEEFYGSYRSEKEDPICFQTGGVLTLYKDLKFDDDKNKKIKLDNQEVEEGETHDDIGDIEMIDEPEKISNTGKI